jgi:hypothetical protein
MLTITLISIGLGLLAWFFWEEINNWIDDIIEEYKPYVAELYVTAKRGARKVIFYLYYWITGREKPMAVPQEVDWDNVPEEFRSKIPDGELVKIGTSK